MGDTSSEFDVAVDIGIVSGGGYEGSSPTENQGIPFVPDASRGILSVDVYYYHNSTLEGTAHVTRYGTSVFILKVEDILSKIPSQSNLERCRVGWEESFPHGETFRHAFMDRANPFRASLRVRHSHVAGFRYVSPIQPLDPKEPTGPRCFFVYDFNPHRKAADPAPGSGPSHETRYPRCASEITREVVGGLGCWKARFDLPAAGAEKRYVALANGGVVVFEVCHIVPLSD